MLVKGNINRIRYKREVALNNTVLSMKAIDKRFSGVHALKKVDFTLREGEIHALVGENCSIHTAPKLALNAGIGFDSGVPEAPAGSIWANASTDNFNAAGVAAKKMFDVVKAKIEGATDAKPVKIIVMNQDASGESLLSRGKGFRDTMIDLIVSQTKLTKNDIKVTGNVGYIASNSPTTGKKVIIEMIVPASAAMTDATNASQAVLNKVVSDNVLGIFCSNEATVKGLLAATNDGAALKSNASYKNLVVFGFDSGAAQKNAVREGYFYGSITQDPYSIGYKAVELAYKAYKGEKVSDVDTGAKFYDKSNMNDADIKGLLYD